MNNCVRVSLNGRLLFICKDEDKARTMLGILYPTLTKIHRNYTVFRIEPAFIEGIGF